MTEQLRDHLVEAHGRWIGELVGVDESTLRSLHELDHVEVSLGLHADWHAA